MKQPIIQIAVTGAHGQLGQCLQQLALENPQRNWQFHFLSSSDLDITSKEEVDLFFDKNQLDYCINAAAYTAVDLAEKEEEKAYSINEKGAHHLALACKEKQVILLHISTDYVFDGKKELPYLTTDITAPINVYGASKRAGEKRILATWEQSIIIRTSWLYSAYGSNFLQSMFRLLEERKELGIVSDQTGSPTNALDLAQALLDIIAKKENKFGLYHYTNKGKTTWYGFTKKIAEFIGNTKTEIKAIPSSAYLTPAKRPEYSLLDTKKIETDYQLNIPNWEESLKTLIENRTRK